MKNNALYFQSSNKFNWKKLALVYVCALLSAFVLGYLYILLNTYLPYVIISFFLAIGFGMGLTFIITFGLELSENRNKQTKVVLASVVGVFAWCSQWCAYIMMAQDGEFPSFSLYMYDFWAVMMPGEFFGTMYEISEVGFWSIFDYTPTGIMLALVWLLEFGIIAGIPFWTQYSAVEKPYSETQNKPYNTKTFDLAFSSVSDTEKDKFIAKVENNPLETIKTMGYGFDFAFSLLSLHDLEGETKQYLSLDNIVIKLDSEGKEEKEVNNVFQYLTIDNGTAANLLAYILQNQENDENIAEDETTEDENEV